MAMLDNLTQLKVLVFLSTKLTLSSLQRHPSTRCKENCNYWRALSLRTSVKTTDKLLLWLNFIETSVTALAEM